MITIIYSTHKDESYNNKFRQHLLQTVGLPDVQILEYVNKNEFSLSEIYNKGIEESKYDIIACIHNDIKLEKGWGKKLVNDFEVNSNYGIIGKAGSCYFPESGVYWEKMKETMVGQVYHEPDGQKKWLSKYSPKFNFLIPVVTIDGLFISFDKTKIKHKFDESIGRFHFYDHLFCVPNYLDGVKIGVTTSFEITHKSVGRPNEEFFNSKDKFVEKYKDFLPLDLKPENIYIPEIKEKPIKNIGKTAIITVTKGKVEMLYECVKSFYEHCNNKLFDFFIADTGSTNEEKEWIRNNILPLGNIKLIEYDYYNFAKINNDVVKNHINDEYEFLLLCNNDIKILNNVLYNMLFIMKNTPKVGTIGCRLHYEDNTIQHDGIGIWLKTQDIFISHINLKSYYNHSVNVNQVIGNTAALMMIKKSIFLQCGMFNENYTTCFEDVELNLECLIRGYGNYISGNSVAYHYESQTRSKNPDILNSERYDFNSFLLPYINKNLKKINKNLL
jgi:GT2 family glycosyltransferase